MPAQRFGWAECLMMSSGRKNSRTAQVTAPMVSSRNRLLLFMVLLSFMVMLPLHQFAHEEPSHSQHKHDVQQGVDDRDGVLRPRQQRRRKLTDLKGILQPTNGQIEADRRGENDRE